MLTHRKKSNIIKEHQLHEKDTGSAEVQIALTSRRIDELATHLKKHPKDKHSRRGLLGMVSRRRRLLRYLLENTPNSYKKVVKKLGLKSK
ncbi:MAG: 30S ribosomal protein S15 [Patescibacteria group bacterium]|nr:30S ribosomal protein S15 [Patescibacteria group bacterium]